jgi:hypothetical protein
LRTLPGFPREPANCRPGYAGAVSKPGAGPKELP